MVHPQAAGLFNSDFFMNGMNAQTGKRLSGIDHLRQSIADILTTRLRSRVFRPDYGSNLFYLIDAPINGATLVKMYAATAEALMQYEPRFLVKQVKAERTGNGAIALDITGFYLPEGKPIKLDGLVIE